MASRLWSCGISPVATWQTALVGLLPLLEAPSDAGAEAQLSLKQNARERKNWGGLDSIGRARRSRTAALARAPPHRSRTAALAGSRPLLTPRVNPSWLLVLTSWVFVVTLAPFLAPL
eukprot:1924518-Prymnesium_polylepis.1